MRILSTARTALTQDEQDFAEVHHNLILAFLHRNRLPFEDWYDIVAIGYLEAVRDWCRREDLHKWKFSTISWIKMRYCVFKQYRYLSSDRRRGYPQSLDAVRFDGNE